MDSPAHPMDCSDSWVALQSVSRVLDCESRRITSRLEHTHDLLARRGEADSEHAIRQAIAQQFPFSDEAPGPWTVWWHLGSAMSADEYRRNGLKATRDMAADLETQLGELAMRLGRDDDESWKAKLESSKHKPNRLGKAAGSSPAWGHDAGPHGFLFKHQCREHRSMYSVPECVLEVCSRLGSFGDELLDAYTTQRTHWLVGFRAPAPSASVIETALLYIYWHITNQQHYAQQVTYGFCGRGHNVPAEDVMSVVRVADVPELK